jgi:hypothetical protein
MFTNRTKTPSREEAAATFRGSVEAAVTIALSARVHRIDVADLLESQARRLRMAHATLTPV